METSIGLPRGTAFKVITKFHIKNLKRNNNKYTMTLLQELQDLVFLELTHEDLEKTREIQSDYVQKTRQYKDMNDAALNGNLNCMKWLMQQGHTMDVYTFQNAVLNGNLENMKWLKRTRVSLERTNIFRRCY